MKHFTSGALDGTSHPFRPIILHGSVGHQGFLINTVLTSKLQQRAGDK